jgi:hypothetical protein
VIGPSADDDPDERTSEKHLVMTCAGSAGARRGADCCFRPSEEHVLRGLEPAVVTLRSFVTEHHEVVTYRDRSVPEHLRLDVCRPSIPELKAGDDPAAEEEASGLR